MGEKTSRARVFAGVALALICLDASELAAAEEPQATWEAMAGVSYATSGAFAGLGASASGLWTVSRYFAVGVAVDAARMSMSGGPSEVYDAMAFRFAYVSAFAGGVAQLRVPLGGLVPYAELALGGVVVHQLYSVNTQCSLVGGPSGGLAVGLKALVGDNVSLGARAAVRPSAWGTECTLVLGPASFEADWLLSGGGTVDIRW